MDKVLGVVDCKNSHPTLGARVAFREKDVCRKFHTDDLGVNFVILHKSAKYA